MSKGSKFVKGGIIGALAGLVTGLLVAPKSGKETREDIKDAANKAARASEDKLKELYGEVSAKKDEAAEMAKKARGKAKEEYDELAKRAEIAKVKLGELISAVRDGQLDDEEYKKASKEAKEVSTEIGKKASKK